MNQIIVIGNLVRDPELKVTAKGISTCQFTIASDRDYKVNGEKVTDYFRVTAWRGMADYCDKYLVKGRKVCVIGELQSSAYTAKDGQPRANLDVNAAKVEILSPKERSDAADKPAVDENGFTDISSDDIPF